MLPRSTWWAVALIVGGVRAACAGEPAAPNLGFKVPPDFEVTLYASDDLATNIYTLTCDAKGRVVVAGPGYIKTLHDDDNVGHATRATLFSNKPASGAQGLCFDGDDLICTGDNGLWKLSDTDGDGQADKSEKWATLGQGEHGAHAVVRGPDGWFYVLVGNDTKVTKDHITSPRSPVKDPQCGCLLRYSPDGKQCEVVAHGFRNPYGLDVDMYGHWFTVDSDAERDHYLPWYGATRLFDIAQGQHHGWVLTGWQQSWNRPAYFFDNVPRLVEIGRGSPTGLVVYRHTAYPEHYRNGVFSACWTLGKIYYLPLTRSGSSYKSSLETFMESTGSSGFNPTGIAVGPAGDLFISMGGRATKGSVYRVRYKKAEAVKPSNDLLTHILIAPQPQASWSRELWMKSYQAIDATEYLSARLYTAIFDSRRTVSESLRAVEILTEFTRRSVSPKTILKPQWFPDAKVHPEIGARMLWSVCRTNDPENLLVNFEALRKAGDLKDMRVQRALWEGCQEFQSDSLRAILTPTQISFALPLPIAELRVHNATIPVLQQLQSTSLTSLLNRSADGFIIQQRMVPPTIDAACTTFHRCETDGQRLIAVRMMQLALGDLLPVVDTPAVYSGYQCDKSRSLDDAVRERITDLFVDTYPTKMRALNLEIERTLAVVKSPSMEAREWITKHHAGGGSLEDDLHALICLSLMPGKRSAKQTQITAEIFAKLQTKMIERKGIPSRNWPQRIGETYVEMVKHDPALPAALAACADFKYPEQSFFILRTTGPEQATLARKLWQLARDDGNPDAWDAEFLQAVATLPRAEYVGAYRELFNEPGLRDAIAVILAREPVAEDRGRLGQALRSVQLPVVRAAAGALTKLPRDYEPAEVAAVLIALRQALLAPQDGATRTALVKLLGHWSGESFAIDEKQTKDLAQAYQPCFAWFAKKHPAEYEQFNASTTYDPVKWAARLEKVAFDQGDVARGKAYFDKQSCHRCHMGQSRLGPDLAGVGARFSRADLFTAILDPSKDVAPAYRTKQVVTPSGEVFTGLMIYDSPEAILLQTGPDTTVRVSGVAPESMRDSPTSLMPNGLLNDATDENLADLYAYLRTITK